MTIVMHEADECRLSLPLCGVIKEVIKGIKIEKGLAAPKPESKPNVGRDVSGCGLGTASIWRASRG